MNHKLILSIALLGTSLGASAQSTAATVQRDVNQQERIEQGLKSGALSTSEAARLEREQSAISRQPPAHLRTASSRRPSRNA